MSVSRHAFIIVITNAVKIICGLVILKIAAMYLSIEDFGRFGQFMALSAIVNMLAGGGVGNGVVKLLAEHKESVLRHRIISSAGLIWLLSCGGIILVLSLTITWQRSYLGSASSSVFYLAIAQIFWGQANFLNSYMVSRQDTRSLMICGVLANIMGVLLFASFFYLYPTLYSALIGFILFNSTPFLMSAFRVFPVYKETHIFYKPKVYPLFIKKLSHYALVIIVGAIALPLTQMLLRDYIGQSLGWLSVGYWQAVLRISDAHMQFFGVVNLSVLLPYFSGLNNHKKLNFKNTQVIKVVLAIIMIAFLSSLTLIILKDWIIYTLYSHDFSAISPFVFLQTIGDFFKVLLSLVVVICLAKGYWKLALFSELLQALSLYVITMLFLSQYEMKALMFAYIISSLLSLAVISVLFWRKK